LSAVPLHSTDAITIPGAVDGFCRMAKDFGVLSLAEVLAPAIYYTRLGVPVAPKVAFDWDQSTALLQGAARDKFLISGAAPKAGQIFSSPSQANALDLIAAKGRDGFYSGAVVEDMVASLQAAGGSHTVEDFAATKATYGTPLRGSYQGFEMLEHPANGQGATALLMLNMMKLFDLTGMDPFGAERAHIEAEISKLAYDARNRFIADADYTTRIAHMMADETAASLANLINPNQAMMHPSDLSKAVHKDTIYITVVDKNRMAVSLIYSIFHAFGSGIASDKYGILFQNRGAGFTLEKGHPNELVGGKRPMHTIIPGMLAKNGRVTMPFGVMGGAYQPNGHARFMSNMVDFGMDNQAAIDAPRCFSDNGLMKIERGYAPQVHQCLMEMGHRVEIPNGPIGGAQAILIGEDGVLHGASDPRKDGCALGY
jgi:gamma-glutamyltranspeptidase/glutathione hydrolase